MLTMGSPIRVTIEFDNGFTLIAEHTAIKEFDVTHLYEIGIQQTPWNNWPYKRE